MVASEIQSTQVPVTPGPGEPVRGSTTGRPIMALLDLLGRRWSLRVLWELRTGESLTFRELQTRCAEVSSSSVLNDRLRELRGAGIVVSERGRGYALTPEGMRLLGDLAPVDDWARRWARRAARTPERPGRRPQRRAISSMHTVAARISASSSPGATSIPYVSRTRNQRLEISATLSPSRSISYS